jgi:hypothetical protein
MSERHENSVLVALRELRGIEDDRVKREQEEGRARAEAEKVARETAERRAREEEENRRLAEADRLRRIEEEKVAKAREEELRVEEAERRARVDGEMKLQEERMRLEIQSRAGRSPMKAIVGVTLALALIGGVVVYKIQAANKAEIAEKEKAVALERERIEREHAAQIAEREKKILAITRDMNEQLKNARSEADRERIIAEARARKEAAGDDRVRPHKKGGTGPEQAAKPVGVRVPGKRDINDNLLDGL